MSACQLAARQARVFGDERRSGQRGQHRDVLRARIVLAAAEGATNAAIAQNLGVTDDTVRKWRRRFSQHGLDRLRDRPRTRRPRRFAAASSPR